MSRPNNMGELKRQVELLHRLYHRSPNEHVTEYWCEKLAGFIGPRLWSAFDRACSAAGDGNRLPSVDWFRIQVDPGRSTETKMPRPTAEETRRGKAEARRVLRDEFGMNDAQIRAMYGGLFFDGGALPELPPAPPAQPIDGAHYDEGSDQPERWKPGSSWGDLPGAAETEIDF